MKSINIYLVLTMLICFGLLQSCSDDIVDVPTSSSQLRSDFDEEGENNFIPNDVNNEGEIVRGEKRINPFTVERINEAKNYIYGESMEDFNLTHKYVKFSPTTHEHLAALEDWESSEDVSLFDFELEYEILSDGEEYIDPSVENPIYNYQYASVKEEIEFPDVPYVEIDDLYLDLSDPLLLAWSFWNTGNAKEINEYLFNGGLSESQVDELEPQALVILDIPPKPTTPCPQSGYTWQLVFDDFLIGDQIVFVWECRPVIPPPPTPTNDCGCVLPTDKRQPAGCIRVDTDGEFKGVRIAKVRVKDNWFFTAITFTDTNGCWKVDKQFSGNVWMWVDFQNYEVKVKDTGYRLAVAILGDYVGRFKSPPYNNLSVDYISAENDNGSKARKYWAAAQALNTVSIYRTSASADGIPLHQSQLNWINKEGAGKAAAPMLKGVYFSSYPAYIAAAIPGVNVLLGLGVNLQPDIVNRYGSTSTAGGFRGVGYHELGHASHYSLVGEDYWFKYRNHILLNNGYGSLGNFNILSNPDVVALGEAIGEYIGAKYGGRSAGSENSLIHHGFIPTGLMWDLEDDNPDFFTDPITGATVVDVISGFTPSMIFDGLTPTSTNSVQSIRAFRNNLRTIHLGNTSNSAANFNSFVDAWDVFN